MLDVCRKRFLPPPNRSQGYFEYLLTKFSTPEEIFGPLSISELKQDRFVRNTEGYLPTSDVVFLDEIFKASSSILNALLTVLNERKYHNGTEAQDIPLQTLVAASNELPNGQTELSALYDRFLVRQLVDYIDDGAISQLFDLPKFQPVDAAHKLTQEELDAIRQKAQEVVFPSNIKTVIQRIWKKHKQTFKDNSDEQLSDRKLVKVLHLLRISAVTNGRDAVNLSDVMLLKDCLWNNPDSIAQVRDIVVNALGTSARVADKRANTTQTSKHQAVVGNIKGLTGSGTKDDPILIENFNQLMMLSRPDVGKQGYYFRQTADIALEVEQKNWVKIDFNGHYDGQNFNIGRSDSYDDLTVFNNISGGSSVTNLVLKNISLVHRVISSEMTSLKVWVDQGLLGKRQHFGIAAIIQNSRVSCCEVENIGLFGKASNTTVENCVVRGCERIAETFDNGSMSHCFMENVKGESAGWYCELIKWLTRSSIKKCVITSARRDKQYSMSIACSASESDFTETVFIDQGYHMIKLEYGIYKDDNTIPSISETMFNQSYLEHVLGWDFRTVWAWDGSQNRPVLQGIQSVQATTDSQAAPAEDVSSSSSSDSSSSLQQQLKDNIWL